MKKLRLIKPWRLRATRLKLADARWGFDEPVMLATCAAPGSNTLVTATDKCDYADIRCAINMPVAHAITRTAAPGERVNYLHTESISLR